MQGTDQAVGQCLFGVLSHWRSVTWNVPQRWWEEGCHLPGADGPAPPLTTTLIPWAGRTSPRRPSPRLWKLYIGFRAPISGGLFPHFGYGAQGPPCGPYRRHLGLSPPCIPGPYTVPGSGQTWFTFTKLGNWSPLTWPFCCWVSGSLMARIPFWSTPHLSPPGRCLCTLRTPGWVQPCSMTFLPPGGAAQGVMSSRPVCTRPIAPASQLGTLFFRGG